jgi:hypothetical protein
MQRVRCSIGSGNPLFGSSVIPILMSAGRQRIPLQAFSPNLPLNAFAPQKENAGSDEKRIFSRNMGTALPLMFDSAGTSMTQSKTVKNNSVKSDSREIYARQNSNLAKLVKHMYWIRFSGLSI